MLFLKRNLDREQRKRNERKSMRKSKLEMKKTENRQALQVTFLKQKKGQFKKVEELSVLTVHFESELPSESKLLLYVSVRNKKDNKDDNWVVVTWIQFMPRVYDYNPGIIKTESLEQDPVSYYPDYIKAQTRVSSNTARPLISD
ncbi:MADS-box transcription factor 5-like [Aristolochia californica]|uniref:MADS-box transcription factor 5-like n=1 Tax=Aristolochia californica TaxID=171875 RepID=UPI0035E3631B